MFLRFIKNKSDGEWEKPSKGEGKVIKFSLEEMVSILQVLGRKITSWSSYHKFKNDSTKISFEWQNGKEKEKESKTQLRISAGVYSKAMNFEQAEVFRMLLEHVLKEKIEFATIQTTNGNHKHEKSSEQDKEKKEILPQKVEKTRIERNSHAVQKNSQSSNETKLVQGKIKGETGKALLIDFSNGSETWIPKSIVRSQFTNTKEEPQSFLIDTWILKKNKILAN